MSYSFTVRGATSGAVIAKINEQFDKIVEAQPIHAVDRDLAVSTATSFVNMITEPTDREYAVSVNGWVQTRDGALEGVCVGVTVSLANPEA